MVSTRNKIKTDMVIACEDEEIVDLFIEASKLKYEYSQSMKLRLKPEFRNLYKKVEDILDNRTCINKISSISKYLLLVAQWRNIKKTRQTNYVKLLTDLTGKKLLLPCFNKLKKVDTPLYFPVIIDGDRELLQKRFAEEDIYTPIIWPIPKYLVNKNIMIHSNLYKHLLCIPCDQRYSIDEMDYINKTVTQISI
jgi:hypothetical protein